MNDAIAWLVRNPVAARLTVILVLAGGFVAGTSLREEIFPQTDLDRISIEVPYLGAAPEEVEAAVVLRIEEAVQGIEGVEETRSLASEGAASVTVDLAPGTDAQRVVDEVANNVGAITTCPAETERPIVRRLTTRNHVTDVAIAGPLNVFELKALAERVRDDLLAAPEITLVEIVNAPVDEIAIEVSEAALRRHGFTFDLVADAVRRSSVDLPGGAVRTDGGEILLRTIGQAHRRAEFENLVLWTRPDGSRLRIRDVATVVDGFAEQDRHARFDGDPAIMIAVLRTGNQSALDIADAVRRYVAAAQAQLPDDVSITVWRDQARVLGDLRSLMLREGALGFVLVFALLTLFVDIRLALWVAVGVSFSILGTLALMPGLGVSVNVVSLFAFTLVIGIMVDDSIIVGENVRRHQELHGDSLRGAIDGAQEIAPTVLAAVLTTVAAFTPLMFVPGMLGELCRIVPLVGITCMLFSLVEALGILPAHLSDSSRTVGTSLLRRFEGLFADGLRLFVRTCYLPILDAALRWRYLTAANAVALLILTGAMVVTGAIGFHFLPSIEDNYVVASVSMPTGRRSRRSKPRSSGSRLALPVPRNF